MNIHDQDQTLRERFDAKQTLRKTIKDLISSLKYELEYAEEIQHTLENPQSKLDYIEELLGEHTQAGENLSYLIRDLNPEYEMQQGNFDYFSRELKKVQDYITAKNEEE
jgi:DNA repair exonuclease SbcCD ATPase subunit